jgi:hypothetical protein
MRLRPYLLAIDPIELVLIVPSAIGVVTTKEDFPGRRGATEKNETSLAISSLLVKCDGVRGE